MKKLLLALSILFVFATAAIAQTKSGLSAEKNTFAQKPIAELMQRMITATIKVDLDTWSRNTADDFVGSYDEDTFTKKELYDSMKSGEDVVTSIANDNVKIRIYGNAAIATGIAIVKETYKGKDISGKSHFTNVFINQDGHWLLASEHLSKIP